MNKILNVVLILLIIVALTIFAIIAVEYLRREKNEEKLSAVVKQIENIKTDSNIKPTDIKFENYNVEGIIDIPKINIKYPIVDKTSDEAMKVAITKFWGEEINQIGNYCMAGHNYKNGTMFGKTKYLQIGDIIKMTDLNLNTVEYEVFKIYTIDPNDVSCVKSVDPYSREITLITCTNGHRNRLIVKAREINK